MTNGGSKTHGTTKETPKQEKKETKPAEKK